YPTEFKVVKAQPQAVQVMAVSRFSAPQIGQLINIFYPYFYFAEEGGHDRI
ncbi:MAG: hypothetical protein F6K22_40135, partial [Okeania sp. SIO2F4]|nr:hypothetical protein [Okeania sp. SIO2F4]